jgi:anti-sigma regulatory factor (Ser/Thr protein kinase)
LSAPRRADDVALLVLRSSLAGQPFSIELPAWPRELAGLRRGLQGWLRRSGVPEDVVGDVVVAVNEAAANAIEHAYGLHDARFSVRAERIDGDLRFEVADTGRWRAARFGHDRGRGLDLIHLLVDEVAIDPGSHGTTVRLVRRLPSPAS